MKYKQLFIGIFVNFSQRAIKKITDEYRSE